MLINSDRWQLAHNYHWQRQNLLYQSLFQAGIVTGLAVSPIPPPQNVPAKYRDGRWLLIHRGIAIDAHSNFIIVSEPMEFRLASQPLAGDPVTVYLVISFVDPATLRSNGSDILTETFRNELPHRIGGWSFCLFLCPSCFIAPQDFEVALRHPRLTRLVPNPDH